MQTVSLKNLEIDYKMKALYGLLPNPKKSLIGAIVFSKENPEIKGFVGQAWRSDLFEQKKSNTRRQKKAYWKGIIFFDSGWEFVLSRSVTKLFIKEFDSTKTSLIEKKKTEGLFYHKFVQMNKWYELSSFYIDIRGGSTEGKGRNEHGLPHFHVIQKNTRKEIAKVCIPEKQNPVLWKKTSTSQKISLLVLLSGSLTRNQKRELVDWLAKNNFKNLLLLNKKWGEMNKHNLRALIKETLISDCIK